MHGNESWIRKTLVFLLVCQVVILGLDIVFNYFAVVDDDDIRELFNVARELSIPNWFSSVQEAAVGLVFWLLYVDTRRVSGPRAGIGWAVCSALFFYVGLDDGTQLHERVSTAIADYFAVTAESGGVHRGAAGWIGTLLDHFPSYSWQVLFGPPLAAGGLFLVVFLWRRLPRREVLLLYTGLLLYGAAQAQDYVEGLETPYEWLTERLGTDPYTVPHFSKMGEEYCEMLGTTVVLGVMLRHYARRRTPGGPDAGAA